MNRLLVIEDHPIVLQALCRMLSGRGTQIASATTLRAARERALEDDPYDLVICENQVSDGTALEFLGWLRWQQQINVPFLLIARHPDVDCQAYDQFSVLKRPFRPEQLLAQLDSLLKPGRGLIARQIPFAGARD